MQAQGSAQTTHEVNQFSFSFEPRDVTIDVGDTVRWIWSGGLHDTVEGTDAFYDPDEDAWGAQLNQDNPVFELVFDEKFLFENPRAGHFYPYVCTPHIIFNMTGTVTVSSPWTNLGSGLAGTAGEPLFWGEGPLSSGSANTLHVEDANPSSPAALFAGFVQGAAPFKGGTLVPVPWILQLGLSTSGAGSITLPFVMPPGLTGIDLYMQVGVQDPGAPAGIALTNALEATGV
ncbi:MAG: cupredoxin domain-containing protein [Planctomycetota bacterium]